MRAPDPPGFLTARPSGYFVAALLEALYERLRLFYPFTRDPET